MPADDSTQRRLRELLAAGGLTLSDDDLAQLAVVYARFAPDRERLRAVSLGETEPAIIFPQTLRGDEGQ